jgi:uncharacterized protein DUF6894
MPKYFFHVHDDLDVEDDEGAELTDLHEARGYAIRSARSLMCDTLMGDGRISLEHRIDIEDGHSGVLATVQFADALEIKG